MRRRDLVQSIVRGLDVLELVGSANRPIPLYYLCTCLRLKKQTVYNTVHTLTEKGYLEKVGRPARYHLGPALARVRRVQSDFDMLQRAVPSMMNLSRRTGGEVVLGEYVGGEVACLLRVPPGRREVPTNVAPWPLHSYGTGLVFQAYWSPAELLEYRRRHPFSESSVGYWKSQKRLDRFLALVRRRGYMVLRNENFRAAAPIFDSTGKIRAFIAVVKPLASISPQEEKTYREWVCQAAGEIMLPPPRPV